MPFQRELLTVAALLVGCVLVLVATFSAPDADQTTASVDLVVAEVHPPAPPVERVPPPPQAENAVAESSEPTAGAIAFDTLTAEPAAAPAAAAATTAAADPFAFDPAPEPVTPVVASAPTSAPVAASAKPAQPRASGRDYVVQSGDSYWTIARDQLGDANRYRELEDLNSIDGYDLQVGMTIKLPPRHGATAVTKSTATHRAPAEAVAGATYHTVQTGEYLSDISKRHYGTTQRWREIAAANDIRDARKIRVGQKLLIPAVGSSSSTKVSSPSVKTAPATAAADGVVWHKIAKGETLGAIAQKY
ncbi:MAG: LysM peptidoglycan-binding domain-containing protein, partial [Planctomycetota bacterium]